MKLFGAFSRARQRRVAVDPHVRMSGGLMVAGFEHVRPRRPRLTAGAVVAVYDPHSGRSATGRVAAVIYDKRLLFIRAEPEDFR